MSICAITLRAAALAIGTACLVCGVAAAQTQGNSPQRVVDLIEQLRSAGISIIYSTDLVPDSLEVQQEPVSGDPLERLRIALGSYGLTLRSGPRDSFLIVRADPTAPESPAPPPTLPPTEFGTPKLEDLIVSASRYAFSRAIGSSATRIDRTRIDNDPSFGEDTLRATHGLPGMTSSGLTAQFNARGGASNEALLSLDGVRLSAPFHMKDFESLFSSINPRIIDSMDVYTGAFPAEFGNRLSAVVDMRSVTASEHRAYEVDVSTLTSTVLSSGRFADGRGAWTTSARRGNLDLLIDAVNSDVGRPQIVDFFTDLSFEVNERWTTRIGALALDDKISLRDGDTTDASAEYNDRYLWLRIDQQAERLEGNYIAAISRRTSDRHGTIADPQRSAGSLDDAREFSDSSLRADWSFSFDSTHHLRWGAAWRDSDADYRYEATISESLPIATPGLEQPPADIDELLHFGGDETALYASYRAQLGSRLTTELGARWDHQDYLDSQQVSPRVNVLLDLGERASLRASWGRYFQPQRLDEVQVVDGDANLYPPQESEHVVIGFEYLLGDSTTIRLEGYHKEFEDPHPRFENLYTRVSLLPELLPDRVELQPRIGSASGIELSAEGQLDRWDWWISLTRADTSDEFSARQAPRSWEERWSSKAGAIWQGSAWTVAIAATWHSGWPVSPLYLLDGELVAGPYNSTRFAQFKSLDWRASRRFALRRGELEIYAELSNSLNWDNPCCIDYSVAFDADGAPTDLSLATDSWLPSIPTLGARWRATR